MLGSIPARQLKHLTSHSLTQFNTEQTGCCITTPRPFSFKLMAQFHIDIDSGIIRISHFIYRICPGMSQDTLLSRAFAVPVRIREGLVPSEIGTVYTLDSCHVSLFRVQLLVYALSAGSHSLELFPSLDTVSTGAHGTHAMVIRMSQWAPGLHA